MVGQRRVAIIGAGLGGLCAAIKLREAGYEVLVFDRNPKVGGVWYENAYPGCACDVPVALYQFSFAQSPNWTRIYPQQPEIQAYAEALVDMFQLHPVLQLGEAVDRAEWHEDARVWHLTTASGTVVEADAVVGALGQLNRPSWPDIDGLEEFAGPAVHSARWDPDLDWESKRVGVIGSAASAVQIIPELAKTASHVSVFQRTPNWVVPRNDAAISPEQIALMMTQPEVALELNQQNRDAIWRTADYFNWQVFQWTEEGRAAFTRIATDHLRSQVPDKGLRAKLKPDYPVGCKRILISDDFYPALLQDNVELVTKGIKRIHPNGIETQDDRHHLFDILVFATGFETTDWKWSVDVVGRNGRSLNESWAEAPEAYLGITVADFPNLFVLYGPNTNLGHTSITIMLESQVDYTVRALQALDSLGARALAPTQAAQTRFNEELQAALARTVWADPDCLSWYKTGDGRITQNWSSHTRAYRQATASVRLQDYDLIR